MNRLNELADKALAARERLCVEHPSSNVGDPWVPDALLALKQCEDLLRSASKADAGMTEWGRYDDPNRTAHNADLSAARVRIAAVEAERDAAEKRLEALPHTHDGQPIVPGMTLYVANPSDWSRPDLVKDGRPVLTSFTAQDYEVHPHYRQWKMFADRESAKIDAEADRAAALAAKESKQ